MYFNGPVVRKLNHKVGCQQVETVYINLAQNKPAQLIINLL